MFSVPMPKASTSNNVFCSSLRLVTVVFYAGMPKASTSSNVLCSLPKASTSKASTSKAEEPLMLFY